MAVLSPARPARAFSLLTQKNQDVRKAFEEGMKQQGQGH